MPSLLRSLGYVFAVGMVIGIGVLLAIPSPLEEPRPLFARVREEAPPPCSHQTWPMMERRCQSWTTARPGAADSRRPKTVKQPEPAVAMTMPPAQSANAAPVTRGPTPTSQPQAAPTQAAPTQAAPTQAAQQPVASGPDRPQKTRRAENPHGSIPVTVHGSDRSRRTIMITPTSQQDVYYYAARRTIGIGGTAATW